MKFYHITTEEKAEIIKTDGLWPVGIFKVIFAATSYDDAVNFGLNHRLSSPVYVNEQLTGFRNNNVLCIFEIDGSKLDSKHFIYMDDDKNIFENPVVLISTHAPPGMLKMYELDVHNSNANHLFTA